MFGLFPLMVTWFGFYFPMALSKWLWIREKHAETPLFQLFSLQHPVASTQSTFSSTTESTDFDPASLSPGWQSLSDVM
jgi:hypothetical protein